MRRFCLSTLFCLLLLRHNVVRAAEPVDYIVSGHWVVAADRVIENGAVAVRGDRIAAIGARAQIDTQFKPKQRIDAPNGIVAPGLINTHTHAAMSLLRGVADDLKLQDWLTKFIFPIEAKFVSPEFVRDGTKLACAEMLLSGTTTFTDMYYFEEVVAEAAKQCGMRAVLGQTIIQFAVADAKTPADGLARTEAFLRTYAKDPLIVPAVAPHALYTNDEKTLRAARALADRYKAPLIMHLSETRQENDDMQATYGGSPTAVLDRWGVLTGRSLMAHGVWLSAEDIQILKMRGTGIAHCPSSNMKLASGIAPVTALLSAGIAVGLGPDGPAGSNNDFNLFEEMDLAAKLQKVARMDPTVLPAETAFRMATIDGAKALGMDREIGSLEPGKRADLIVVTTAVPNATPLYNVYSDLVYATKGSDVTDVMVNGRVVVRGRKVTTLDLSGVLAAADDWRRKIAASTNKRK
jgi:5-methylthioadenosine/S-adenosylhomocysteine deaminase